MRKVALTFGLLLVLAGVFAVGEGAQAVTSLAETFGFASRSETDKILIAPTLVPVQPSNYTFLSANLDSGAKMKGSLEVADEKEIAFYVMNEGNFTLWRTDQPSNVIRAKSSASSYNFTFTTTTPGAYYFVFDNHDTSRRTVIFSLSVEQTIVIVNPLIGFAGYELLAVGVVCTIIGVRGRRRRPETEPPPLLKSLSCRFCGGELEGNEVFCKQCGKAQH